MCGQRCDCKCNRSYNGEIIMTEPNWPVNCKYCGEKQWRYNKVKIAVCFDCKIKKQKEYVASKGYYYPKGLSTHKT